MKPRYFFTTCTALLFIVLACAVSQAEQQSPEGLVIRRITIETPSGVDSARLRDAVRVREGDKYSRDAVQADIAALYALGDFSSVRADTAVADGKVDVAFRFAVRPRVAAVEFTGDLGETQSTLEGLIQTKVGSVAGPYNLKADLRVLHDHYSDEGYLFAEVRQQTADVDGGVKVTWIIQAGPKVKMESIQFTGHEPIPESDLRKAMLYSREGGFEQGRFDWQFLRSDLLAVRELVRRRGYLDATVGYKPLFDEAKERAHLLIQVELGPLYHVSGLTVRISGATPDIIPDEKSQVIPVADLLAAIETKEGAVYSQEQLDKDEKTIGDMYGKLGYIKAHVGVERTFAEDKPEVGLRLDVSEGPKVYVSRVLIRGNAVTKDHVVRRAVSLIPGSVFTTTEMDESKRKLLNTGLFGGVDMKPGEEAVRIRPVDTDQADKSDAIVEVIEGGSGNFSIGAQISSDTGLAANLSLTLVNFDALDFPRSWRQLFKRHAFLGGGQKLTISLTPGEDYQDYRLSWLNPSVWDSPYFVGFDVYSHEFNWDGFYDDDRTGGSVTVGRSFKDLSVSLTPKVEHVDIHNVDTKAPADAFDAKGGHTRNSLTLSLGYDKRDNVFVPSKGYNLGFDAEMAGTALGGDVDWMRESVQARKWWTVWTQENKEKHTVSVGGEFTLLQRTGSDEIPMFDKLFTGGVGSLRGFQYRGIGPVDDVHHKQVGGTCLAVGNTEYEFPIVREILRGVLFADAGSLSDTVSGLGQVRASTGVGVRLRIPGISDQRVPISLFLSTPLATKKHDKTETFSFTIGTGFSF